MSEELKMLLTTRRREILMTLEEFYEEEFRWPSEWEIAKEIASAHADPEDRWETAYGLFTSMPRQLGALAHAGLIRSHVVYVELTADGKKLLKEGL